MHGSMLPATAPTAEGKKEVSGYAKYVEVRYLFCNVKQF